MTRRRHGLIWLLGLTVLAGCVRAGFRQGGREGDLGSGPFDQAGSVEHATWRDTGTTRDTISAPDTAPTSDELWAAGESGVALHYISGIWSVVSTGVSCNLVAVHGTARDDVWFGCMYEPTVVRWTGSAFFDESW